MRQPVNERSLQTGKTNQQIVKMMNQGCLSVNPICMLHKPHKAHSSSNESETSQVTRQLYLIYKNIFFLSIENKEKIIRKTAI